MGRCDPHVAYFLGIARAQWTMMRYVKPMIPKIVIVVYRLLLVMGYALHMLVMSHMPLETSAPLEKD